MWALRASKRLARTRRTRLFILGIIAVVIVLGILFVSQGLGNGDRTPTTNIAALSGQTEVESATVSFGLPKRLKIPKINVNAVVDPMGLEPNGDMQAPSGPKTTGWYKFGSNPGNVGSAAIAGHQGRWKTGEDSVFDDLNKLGMGDEVYVEDEHGQVATFTVRETRTYGQNESAPDVFVSHDGKAHLNLITCSGDWDRAQRTYLNRLVVFTDAKTK